MSEWLNDKDAAVFGNGGSPHPSPAATPSPQGEGLGMAPGPQGEGLGMAPKKMTEQRLMEANAVLKKYKAAKTQYEQRLYEDDKWWRGHAWDTMREQGNANAPKRTTKWLVNVILGKHADLMDAFPEPVILPREKGDEQEAKKLTSILPVILEQNSFEDVYSQQAWEKSKHGTGCYAVYWDSGKLNGLGDISICGVDMMNLYWEPGIEDIQQSEHVFLVSAQDIRQLRQRYPQLQDKNLNSELTLKQYETESKNTREEKALVIDWYYHTYEGGQKRLQYCKYVGLNVLYASEDDPQTAQTGWYADGDYPFVLDVLYPQKESPAGWGFIDLGRDTQEEIDLLSYAIQINARAGAIPRYFRKRDSAINLEQFMDFTDPIIEVEGGLGEADMLPVQHYTLDSNYKAILDSKVDELKQTCGNQDVTNGITGGVTAASGIAALQESASRNSRDANRGTYRAYSRILELVIERIRQFYDVQRTFRILGEQGAYEYVQMDNSGLAMQPNEPVAGMPMGWRKPVFDIEVSAQKQNAYSKISQNELALQLLNAGVFNPQLVDQSMLLLKMMDFKGKDEIIRDLEQMQTMQQQLAQWQQLALALAQRVDQALAQRMAADIVGQAQGASPHPSPAATPSPRGEGLKGTAGTNDAAHMVRAREQTRESTLPE